MTESNSQIDSNSDKLSFSFYKFFSARIISNFGTYFNMIALNIFILEMTNDPKWIGITLALRTFSRFSAGPFVGHIADVIDRKKLMILSDIILGLGMIGLAFIPDTFLKSYLIFLMVILGVFSSLFDVGFNASLPHLLNKNTILKGNSLIVAGKNIIIGLASIVAIISKIFFKNYESIFILDGFTYFLSSIIIITVKIPNLTRNNTNQENIKNSFLDNFKDSYKEILTLDNSKILLSALAPN